MKCPSHYEIPMLYETEAGDLIESAKAGSELGGAVAEQVTDVVDDPQTDEVHPAAIERARGRIRVFNQGIDSAMDESWPAGTGSTREEALRCRPQTLGGHQRPGTVHRQASPPIHRPQAVSNPQTDPAQASGPIPDTDHYLTLTPWRTDR